MIATSNCAAQSQQIAHPIPTQLCTQLTSPPYRQNHSASCRAVLVRKEHSRSSGHLTAAWKGGEGSDIAVFRFTLGIPGFDDALIPRVVGVAGAFLILSNHVLDRAPALEAQTRTELLGGLLCALCIATPSVGRRLQEALPGRGRVGSGAEARASRSLFQLAADVPEASKTELAWSSYALLRNTNSSGLLVAKDGKVLAVRGAVGLPAAPSSNGTDVLGSVAEALAVASMPGSPVEEVVAGRQASVYLPDAAALASAGAAAWAFMPQSAQSLLVQALLGAQPSTGSTGDRDAHAAGCEAERGVLLLWSDRPRALSQRERLWAAAVAAKLHDVPGVG